VLLGLREMAEAHREKMARERERGDQADAGLLGHWEQEVAAVEARMRRIERRLTIRRR